MLLNGNGMQYYSLNALRRVDDSRAPAVRSLVHAVNTGIRDTTDLLCVVLTLSAQLRQDTEKDKDKNMFVLSFFFNCAAAKAQYTPPTPTRRNCRDETVCRVGVGGVNTIRN